MAKIELSHLISSPKGKIVKEAQNAHKKDTVFGRDIPKSKHHTDLKKMMAKRMSKKNKSVDTDKND